MQEEFKNPIWENKESPIEAASYKTFFRVLPRNKRLSFFLLTLMMVFATSLELLGIGLVLPIVGFISDYDRLVSNVYIANVIGYLGNPSEDKIIIWALSIFVFVFFLKNVYIAFLTYLKERFVFEIKRELTMTLYSKYIKNSYSFNSSNNSSEIMRNLVSLPIEFERLLTVLISILSEILVLVGIFALFLVLEPIPSLIMVLILFSLSLIYYLFFKSRSYDWGIQRQFHQGKQFQSISESLGAVKDIKSLKKEDFFIDWVGRHVSKVGRVALFEKILLAMPRLWLELCVVFSFAGLIVSMTFFSDETDLVIPTIAVFAFAAVRLIPSATILLSGSQSIRIRSAPLSILDKELKDARYQEPGIDEEVLSFKSELKIQNLNFSYPGKGNIFRELNLEIKKGEFVGIKGESGSGKSTLVDLILGFYSPDSGSILIDGKDILKTNYKLYRKAGLVSQDIFLLDRSIAENISLGEKQDINFKLLDEAIKKAQLSTFIETLNEGYFSNVGERGVQISGGQLQRIGIARALYNDPDILVFDEATSALDEVTASSIIETILSFKGKKTMLFISHNDNSLKHCDRILEIKDGQVLYNN